MGTRVYVGNLPFGTDGSQLRELFSRNDRMVNDATVITDRDTGRSRGFGFVEMSNNEEAQAVISELNGFTLEGRAMTVNEARERTERGGGGGGGGFDRY